MLSLSNEVGRVSRGQPGLGLCCVDRAGPRPSERVAAAVSEFRGTGWLSSPVGDPGPLFWGAIRPFGVELGQAIWESCED
jgi:hypothetical protein